MLLLLLLLLLLLQSSERARIRHYSMNSVASVYYRHAIEHTPLRVAQE
jgi:hypothetical protein